MQMKSLIVVGLIMAALPLAAVSAPQQGRGENPACSGLRSRLSSLRSRVSSITRDLRDAPIRTVIEMAFKQAGITNYVIDNNVAGFVTMTITDQPFENALKLIMRAATTPLTYIKENNVYIVKPRQITVSNPTPAPDLTQDDSARNNVSFERIPLIFIDPMDLMGAFGNITFIRQFNRGGGGGMGGGMGGFGGGRNF